MNKIDNGTFLKQMGKKMNEIRKAKGISLRKMEELTDIDNGNISRIENGKKNSYILTLKTIADALEVDVKKFL